MITSQFLQNTLPIFCGTLLLRDTTLSLCLWKDFRTRFCFFFQINEFRQWHVCIFFLEKRMICKRSVDACVNLFLVHYWSNIFDFRSRCKWCTCNVKFMFIADWKEPANLNKENLKNYFCNFFWNKVHYTKYNACSENLVGFRFC